MKAKLTASRVNALRPRNTMFKVWDPSLPGYHVRVMPSGTVSFAIFYRFRGKGRDYTIGKLGRYTASTARAEAVRLMALIADGMDPQFEKKQRNHPQPKPRTLGQFVQESYSQWILSKQKRGDETIALLKANFAPFFDKPIDSVSSQDIDHWCTQKLRAGLSKSTLNRRVTALKGVFNKAVDWKVLEDNPIRQVKPYKVDDGVVRYLSSTEERRLIDALDQREAAIRSRRVSANQWRVTRGYETLEDIDCDAFVDYLKPLVLVALHTGLRRGELFDLCWDHVFLDGRSPRVTVVGIANKSGKTRHVPLNTFVSGVLTQWRKQFEFHARLVFPNPRTGERLGSVKRSWGKVLEDAGITGFRFHDLRHSFASKLVSQGVSLYAVQLLLGHQSPEMTKRYSHLAPEHQAAAVELLVP